MPTDHLPSSSPSSPLMAVAVDHCHGFNKPPSSSRRCRLRSFPHPSLILFDPEPTAAATGIPLRPTAKFSRSLSTSCLYSAGDGDGDGDAAVGTGSHDGPRRDQIARLEIIAGRRSRTIQVLVVEAAIALASGAIPVPVADGVSTAHYLFNRFGESFAVVKPMDEDVALPLQGCRPGLKHSTQASEIGIREVAAYLLDHGAFAGVPPTALIMISSPVSDGPADPDQLDEAAVPLRKIASIQRFVPHEFDAGELGPSRFTVASVHRVGILDVRILNVDRHAGNILVKKGSCSCCCYDGSCGAHDSMAELVPIDHGLCLPEIIDDPYFEWLHWPQASVPFSDAEAEYVSSLDPFRDVELLRTELPLLKEPCLRTLVICTTFLKRAVAAGLCLADIGHMMTREFTGLEDEPSEFEALCKRVEDSMKNTTLAPEDAGDEEEANGGEEAESAGSFQFDMQDDGQGGGEDEEDNGSSDGGSVKEHKIGGATSKSFFSFSAAESNNIDGSRSISFEGLSEEEWRSFMEGFERLLPEALEARKSMGLMKQRFGTRASFEAIRILKYGDWNRELVE